MAPRRSRRYARAVILFGVGQAAPRSLVNHPGCRAYTPGLSYLITGAFSSFGSTGAIPLPIPNVAPLACNSVVFQGVAVSSGGLDTSNAVVAMLGY